MKHINVALFTVHEGCPHLCSFCNQRSISGSEKRVTAQDVHSAAKRALEGTKDVSDGEIAFFGGSFTLIERGYMLSLLEAAKSHIDAGEFRGIRISTRPDGIDEEICSVLARYGVTAVELGAQSMDDRVLEMNRRGHTAQDVVNAVGLLKAHGFETGLQMMTGLYGSSDEDSIETARRIIALRPATVRIYPTVVMENTELCRLMRQGEYTPQTPGEAAELGSILIPMFEEAGIKVIRFGLHSGGGVEGGFAGGAYHPALREMAESRIFRRIIKEKAQGREGAVTVYVPVNKVSQAVGQHRENIMYLREAGLECKIRPLDTLEGYNAILEF